MAGLIAMYDATIAYADQCVGELIKWIRSHNDGTVVVVTGDHDELFGERGLYAHKLVTHDAVCHVPMVVAGPTEMTEYEGELVQPIDIARHSWPRQAPINRPYRESTLGTKPGSIVSFNVGAIASNNIWNGSKSMLLISTLRGYIAVT